MKDTINKGIANPHTQHQRIANPLELGIVETTIVSLSEGDLGMYMDTTAQEPILK